MFDLIEMQWGFEQTLPIVSMIVNSGQLEHLTANLNRSQQPAGQILGVAI
jgi:hypothetical protein